jgi:hypothetical protein
MLTAVGWKKGLLCLIGVGALVYLFSGSDSGTYRAPQALDSQEEPIAEFNRAKYAESLKSMKGGHLITKIETGLSEFEIRLQAGARWQALGEAARLRSARVFWEAWAKIHPPNQRFKSRIVIVDKRGTKIGGSRLLDPSKIWVRKE